MSPFDVKKKFPFGLRLPLPWLQKHINENSIYKNVNYLISISLYLACVVISKVDRMNTLRCQNGNKRGKMNFY